MTTKLIAFILAAGVSTLAAQNQERPGRPNQERPERPNPANMFDRIDANKDERVDLKELTDFRANMPQGPRGNRGGAAVDPENRPGNNDRQVPAGRGPGNRGPGMPTPEEMIKIHDKDEDGKLNREEFGNAFQRQARGPGQNPGPRAQKPE